MKYLATLLLTCSAALGGILDRPAPNIAASNSYNGSFSGNGSGLTNVNASAVSLTSFAAIANPPGGASDLNAPNYAGIAVTGVGAFNRATASGMATNIQIPIAGTSGEIAATLKIFSVTSPTNYVGNWTNTPLGTWSLTLPAFSSSAASAALAYTLSPPVEITSGQWLLAMVCPDNGYTNGVRMNIWYNSVNNTNYPRQSYVSRSTTTTAIAGGEPGYGVNSGPGFVLKGYLTTQVATTAETSGYAPSTTALGMSTNTVWQALENLTYQTFSGKYPFAASNTIVMVDGDSKAYGLASVLRSYPWFSSCAWFTNLASPGGNMSSITNAWQTTNRFVSSRLRSATNGLYIWWSLHNDNVSGDAIETLLVQSNHLAQVASSNWNILLITTQPRASYFGDTANQRLALPFLNNWGRETPLARWRVDADRLMPNCFDPLFFYDATHLTELGNTNIANAVVDAITSPAALLPQTWVNAVGTNIVISCPPGASYNFAGSNGSFISIATNIPSPATAVVINSSGSTFAASVTASNVVASSGVTVWQTNNVVPAWITNGLFGIWNSNGTPFKIISAPGSATQTISPL